MEKASIIIGLVLVGIILSIITLVKEIVHRLRSEFVLEEFAFQDVTEYAERGEPADLD